LGSTEGLTALALVTAAAEHIFLQQSGDIWQANSLGMPDW
jgi:hypothetical protein